MKSTNGLLAAGGIFLALFGLTGCETKSVDELEVQIHPQTAEIRNGETIELRATGWDKYTWSLSNPSWGVLSTKVGDTTYYRAIVATNGTQVVTVTAAGQSGTASNEVVTLTGEAYIKHVDATPPASGGSLSVSPGSGVTLQPGQSQTYTARGGDGSYTWSLSDSTLGWLSSTHGDSTTYTAVGDSGTQYLTVTSGDLDQTVQINHTALPGPTGQ